MQHGADTEAMQAANQQSLDAASQRGRAWHEQVLGSWGTDTASEDKDWQAQARAPTEVGIHRANQARLQREMDIASIATTLV